MPEKTKNSNELEMLRGKCLLFNRFMVEAGVYPAELLPAIEECNRLVEEAHARKSVRPLRAMNNDIDDQVFRHMPPQMSLAFRRICKQELGIDFKDVELKIEKSIQNTIKRGKIRNRQEYELLMNYIDEIYTDDSKQAELDHINQLIVKFEAKGE